MTSQQSRGSPAVPADRSATPSPQLVVELIDLLERLLVDRRVPQVRTAVTHTRAQTHTDSRRQTESGASIMPFKQVARHHANRTRATPAAVKHLVPARATTALVRAGRALRPVQAAQHRENHP